MGCCQDREVKITQDRAQIGMQRRKVRRQILKREIDTESMKNQDTMIVQDHFEIISEGTEPDLDEKALKNLLENYRQNKQWDEIVQMISNRTQVTEAHTYISWAAKPSTIGSLAVVYLCKECKMDAKLLAPYVEEMLPLVITSIKMGSDDLRENMLLLLFYFVDVAGEVAIDKLLKLNVFSVLVRWLLCSKPELRHISADICAKIYRCRKEAQNEFLKVNGAFKLVQLIAWSSEQDEVLYDLLGYLIDLMQDVNEEPIIDNISRVHESMVWDIIRNIDTTQKSQELMEQLDSVIRLLSYDDL